MELIKVSSLKKIFRKENIAAVNDVSFSIFKGEVLGLVGESGCGKTTLARAILRLIDVQGGSVLYKNENLLEVSRSKMLKMRKDLQIIFQDPYMSLDPRMNIARAIEEVYIIHHNIPRQERRKKVSGLLEQVGLDKSYLRRLPSELSGGERQRVGIARALASGPEFIICDEPVSNLDISIQAQILNLLIELQKKKHLTYLFISHDLEVIASICDRVAVMKAGRFVEMGHCEEIFKNPKHEYTKSLLEADRFCYV